MEKFLQNLTTAHPLIIDDLVRCQIYFDKKEDLEIALEEFGKHENFEVVKVVNHLNTWRSCI